MIEILRCVMYLHVVKSWLVALHGADIFAAVNYGKFSMECIMK